jgi:hypothetical protein
MTDPPLVKTQHYLIFRVVDGEFQDFGLYETYAAAKERMTAAGLAAGWKIAPIDCWLRRNNPGPPR